MKKPAALIKPLRYTARVMLVLLVLFWLFFALLSGTTTDDGIEGLLSNLPNALPWLLLVPVIYVAFRRELFGGALISCAGVASIALFNAWEAPVVLLGVSLPLILLGAAFMAAWYLQRVGEGH